MCSRYATDCFAKNEFLEWAECLMLSADDETAAHEWDCRQPYFRSVPLDGVANEEEAGRYRERALCLRRRLD